ncbi:ABC transporter permease [Pseudoalteromonas sp. DL2-H2.2]|uniref:ABC transporter permease n=1 Tax=Pseudoalteromonas sp. DL2-H2.2 TaxID=2908889 RepID=UPI001F362327|nr:ABC transporter permease [Pseudoalteromonas sp. DL2-H2.2]MCF2910431.1 ABC transporter permease [Pseudoalteromonas sp. DL2-H2.2]
MLELYLMGALRAFLRQKFHLLLNVTGLAIGLGAALLIALYSQFELSYDDHQPNASHVFRLEQSWPSMGLDAPVSSPLMAEEFTKLNDIEAAFYLLNLSQRHGSDILIRGQQQKLDKVFAATDNLTQFIALDILHGELAPALTQPAKLALSRTQAIRLFGQSDVIGQTLVQGDITWSVVAVFADLPDNTHFDFNGLAAMTPSQAGKPALQSNDAYVYLRTRFDDSAQQPRTQLEQVLTEQYNEMVYKGKNMVQVTLLPLLDIHLYGHSRFEFKANGSADNVHISIGLSILLILVASFNFINMSTAKAAQRAKEVGVKKALGASRFQLMLQFLLESVLITLIAGLLALVFVELALPWFNQLVDKSLSLTFTLPFIALFSATIVTVGVIAGLYPALFIASFDAKRVLSGDLQRGATAIWVRKSLLVAQAALSITLIIATFVLYQQLVFLTTLDTGYAKENRLEIRALNATEVFNSRSALTDALQRLDGVTSVGVSDTALTSSTNTSARLIWPGADPANMPIPFIGTGYQTVENQGLTLLHGRDFSRQFSSDWYQQGDESQPSASIIISREIAMQANQVDMDSLIGQTWRVVVGNQEGQSIRAKVVGIVEDIKIGSSRDASSALFFICGYSRMSQANLVLAHTRTDLAQLRQEVQSVLQQHLGVVGADIESISKRYQLLYQGDQQASKVIFTFTALAIVLTVIGIFGLSSFSAQRRSKEVAIRKVLGATRPQLINLLAMEYIKLVLGSALIAFPLAYWLVSDWLTNFNERVAHPYAIYLIAAALVGTITWLTVATQVFKTASTKPSAALRYE